MSMGLFVTGIVAGIAMVYAITKYFSFAAEPIERETDISDAPEEAPIYTMTAEEMDAWYDSVMEIFK